MTKNIDKSMFPSTAAFQKSAKKLLTCFHVQMLSKIAHRHQFHQLESRGEYSNDGELWTK